MWYAKAEASVCYAVWGSGSVDIQAEDRVIFHSAWKIDGPKVWREFGLASRRRHLTWSMLSIYLGPIFDPWRKTGNSFSLPSPPFLKVPICERHDCTVSRCWGWMKAPGTIDLRWFQRGWRGSAERALPDFVRSTENAAMLTTNLDSEFCCILLMMSSWWPTNSLYSVKFGNSDVRVIMKLGWHMEHVEKWTLLTLK